MLILQLPLTVGTVLVKVVTTVHPHHLHVLLTRLLEGFTHHHGLMSRVVIHLVHHHLPRCTREGTILGWMGEIQENTMPWTLAQTCVVDLHLSTILPRVFEAAVITRIRSQGRLLGHLPALVSRTHNLSCLILAEMVLAAAAALTIPESEKILSSQLRLPN